MSEKPNQLWEIDLVGNIQEKGYGKYIFVAIDHFSKLVEIRVIKRKQRRRFTGISKILLSIKIVYQNALCYNTGGKSII
ncbi:hypothetical protein P3W45_000668 [Vairimorpha bombi]